MPVRIPAWTFLIGIVDPQNERCTFWRAMA